MDILIAPQKLNGTLTAPPSKSYAIRAVLAAVLGGRKTVVKNVGSSYDVVCAVDCAKALGAKAVCDGKDFVMTDKINSGEAALDCGESATLYRLLLPIAAALGIKAKFLLRGSLLHRESDALIKCIKGHGAITDGKILSGKLKSGVYEIDVGRTSQYLSGLMFALPLIDGDNKIVAAGEAVSSGYIDITRDVLENFGIKTKKTGDRYFAEGKYRAPEEYIVEGDWSAAANMLALGAVAGSVTVKGLESGSKQGDKEIVKILRSFGADVTERAGGITAQKGALTGIEIDCRDIPDLVTAIAGVAANASGTTVLKNVARLKNKESFRTERIMRSLASAGIRCSFDGNNISITGGKIKAANFEAVNDHRIIMLNTILSAGADGRSAVRGAECVKKSYPKFFDDYRALGGNFNVKV